MGRHLKVSEEGFIRSRSKHDLYELLKKIKKATPKAVDTLEELMDSKDEKIKLAASSKLVDMEIDIGQKIATDEMQRLIANVKFGGPGQLEVDDTPMVSFELDSED